MTTESIFDLNLHHYQLQNPWSSPSSCTPSNSLFQSHSNFHPASLTSPSSFGSTSLARMESTFCKNFVCCSIPLDDLHDLLEHFEQAHCQQSSNQPSVCNSQPQSQSQSPSNLHHHLHHHHHHHHLNHQSKHSKHSKSPETIVFEDEDEWSGTESGSTNPSSTFDTSFDQSPHSSNLNLNSNSKLSSNSQRKNLFNNRDFLKIDGFGIPPSLLDGKFHHHLTFDQSHNSDHQHLLPAFIDNDRDLDSNDLFDDHSSNQNLKRRKITHDQFDWNSSRDKPFKCSVPGCEKAYKQQNGLKYHKAHGHCSQRTLSTEEELKTFVCHDAVCGKRYKNMNGLRYHYQHTGPHGILGLQLLSLGLHPMAPNLDLSNLNTHNQHRHPMLMSNHSFCFNETQDESSLEETIQNDSFIDH